MRKLGTVLLVMALMVVASQTSRGDRPRALNLLDPVDLPLSADDSITIDGMRYTCGASRRGVNMSGGDVVTAGRFKLRCMAPARSPATGR